MDRQLNATREFQDFGCVPWWCMSGVCEKEELLRQFQWMQDAGIDEFFIYPNLMLCEPGYLSEEWFEMVGFIIREAGRRGMHVWIYDELNWPSGTAGGIFPRDFPQYRMKNLCRRLVPLLPGESYAHSCSAECIRVFLRPQDEPEAEWKIIRLDDNNFVNRTGRTLLLQTFHVIVTNEYNMSSMGARSAWRQRGICDRLSAKAVRAWLSCVHDKYYERFRDECGRTVRGFFYDEPSYVAEYGNIPWTDGLDRIFQERCGYDFLDRLPEFYEDRPGSEKLRYDFWTLVSRRFADCFSRTIAEWCAARNLELTGHCNMEEPMGQNSRLNYTGNAPAIQRNQQIPAMDLLGDHTSFHKGMGAWVKNADEVAHNYLYTAKMVSATARYNGAKRVLSETNGCCDRNLPPKRAKIVWDWLSGAGVSMFNVNGLGYSESGFVKRSGGLYSFFQPWFHQFGAFSSFVRETSRFAAGRLRTEVAVLDPQTTIRSLTCITWEDGRKVPPKVDVSHALVESMAEMMKARIDYELLFEEILEESEVSDGVIHAPNSAFRVLVLPKAIVLTAPLAEKIRAFRAGGGQVFCIEERPLRTPDGQPLDFAALPLAKPEELPSLLRRSCAFPYAITGEGELYTALRDCDGVPTLFLANMGEGSADVRIAAEALPAPIAAKLTGDEPWQLHGSHIHLEPYQSLFLRFGQTVEKQTPPVTWGGRKPAAVRLEGPWEYEISRPNNAFPVYELGMAPNEKEQKEIGEVGLWLPCSWDGCHDLEFSPRECPFYWLRSQFQVEDDSVIDGLSLVYEEAAVVRIRVNGRELSLPRERYPLWTVENHRVGIADAVRRGRNTLEILCRTDEWSSPERKSMFDMNFIDPVVLHGNFATEVGNKVVRLSARPQTLRLGDIGKQGFPWLLGDVRYRLVIQGGRFTALELPDIGEASADGSLNGEPLGTRLWDPFRFDLEGKLRAGENEFIATIPTSLGNFLPRAFPSRRVALTQIGLLQPPELS